MRSTNFSFNTLLKSEKFWKLFAFVLILVYLLLTFQKTTWLGDEGMVLSSALRVARGEVMYRDFFEFWTPGIVYLGALIFKVFGVKILPFRVFFLANLLLIAFLIGRLTQKLLPGSIYLPALVPPLFILSLPVSTFAFYHHWVSLALILTFALILFGADHLSDQRCFVLGIIAGASLLFIQTQGVVINLAFLGWYFFRSLPLLEQKIKDLLPFLAGEALLLLPIVAYFSIKTGLSTFFYDTVIFVLTNYKVHSQQIGVSFLWLITSLFLAWFGYAFKQDLQGNSKAAFVFLTGLLLQITYLSAPNRSHTILGLAFTLPLIAYSYRALWPKIKLLAGPLTVVSGSARVWLIISVLIFYFFVFDFILYSIPSLKYSLTQLSYPIISRAGRLYTYQSQAQKANRLIGFIEQNARSGEYVYVGPYSSYFYVFNNIKNPTRYSQLTPNYNPEWMFAEATAELKEKESRFLVLLPSEDPFYFPPDNQLSRFVQEDYLLQKALPQAEFSRRNSGLARDAIWVNKNLTRITSSDY